MKHSNKTSFLSALFIVLLFSSLSLHAQNAWINEFHYDNTGGDQNEFVEVVIENAGNYTLSDFQLNLYNGGNNSSYSSQTLDQFTEGNTVGGFTIYTYEIPMQNGSPDGLSLSYGGTLISGQFLSYEGSFTASGGPADGVVSTDIGVSEPGSTPVGLSLQLSGTGSQYSDFSWQSPAAATPGTLNNNQTIPTDEVDWCNLQFPESGNIRGGTDFDVYARVYEVGVTDAAGQGAGITAWIGYSTDNTDPSTWTNWVLASYNTDAGNNDEYMANISPGLTNGSYYYAARFQLNGGGYKYGGYNNNGGNFWDGADYVSGVLTVDDVVDWCNLQAPLNGSVHISSREFIVYAQIYEAGYTDGGGQAPNISAWIGYSSADNNPADNPDDWTWVPANYNTDNGNNDEYSCDLGNAIDLPGTYYYASRFQIGSGDFFYGGYNGGFWDNTYAAGTGNRSGQLTITEPVITLNPSALSGFEYAEGSGPSAEQSFTVEGTNVTGDLSITPPTNWEISLSPGGSYQTTPITLTQTGGMVPNTTIYVRLSAGLAGADSPFSGNIVCESSADGIAQNLSLAGTVFVPSPGCATDLFISEYGEGTSGNNKYIEIYNGTGAAVDLTNYRLQKIINGGNWSEGTHNFTHTTLGDGETLVVAHSDVPNADEYANSFCSWNGDDAVGLAKNTGSWTLIDAIGTDGADPGSGWDVAGTSNATRNHRLTRKEEVISPNADWAASAGTSESNSEWVVSAYSTGPANEGHTMSCGCDEPTVHASAITFSNINALSLDIAWTNGNGDSRIVVCREGAEVSFVPVDESQYTANSDYSAGAESGPVGEKNKVVYNGSGSSATITGLMPGTRYHFKIYEFNCTLPNYLTSGAPALNDTLTLPANVTNFTVECMTNTSAELKWDLPAGGFDGILITIREGSGAPNDPTVDGATLNAPNTDFTLAPVYATGSKYVYNGTGTSVTITGLTNGNDYVFKAFTYNASDWSNGTQKSANAVIQDVSMESTFVKNQEIRVSWENPESCYDEIMLVAHEAGSVTTVPSGDGSAYSADASFGNGTNLGTNDYVVYKGTETFVDVSNLTNGTNYCFKIFVRKGNEWSAGVEVCDTPADITLLSPGDLIFVGYDTKAGCTSYPAQTDVYYILTMKDIKPETSFGLLNASYEYGAAAGVRTDEFWGCTSTPGTYVPGRVSIRWTGSSNITAGSIIELYVDGVGALDSAAVNGTDQKSNFSSSGGFCNIADDDPDQIWIFQGIILDYGTSPNLYAKIEGNILFGLSNRADWVPVSDPVNTPRTSRTHPDIECFDMSFAGDVPVNYYKTDALHTGSKRDILANIMTAGNWEQIATNTICNDVPPAVSTSTFTLNAGYAAGTWRGNADENWFNCSNWEEYTVPDADVDVFINNPATITHSPKIDHTQNAASDYSFIARCNNLTIDNQNLSITASNLDTLFVNGDVHIQNAGTLTMDDGTSNPDGILFVKGDWNNSGTFLPGNGTVVFNGANMQSMTSAAGSETFYNLTLTNNNLAGLVLNNHLAVDNTFSQTNSLLNLNSYNIEIKGAYENTNSYFEGDAGSDFLISSDTDNGEIADIYFKNDFNLANFTIDRAGRAAVLMTDLSVIGDMRITNGNITLGAGNNYDVGGSLINTPGTADALLIKSDASGTASLIQQSGAVSATVERFLSGNYWHYFFPPLSQINASVFTLTSWGAINPNVYWYNETIADFWDGTVIYEPTGWTNVNGGLLQTDRGYINFFTADKTYVQTGGQLRDADKSFTLSYTDNGSGNEPVTGTAWDNFEGWNLFGNPYVSALDWNNSGINKSNIESFVYFYDDTQDKYLCYGGTPPWSNSGVSINGGTQFIPAGQAFMVKALNTAHGAAFEIPAAARVHNGQSFYKSTVSEENNYLKMNIKKGDYFDETLIRTFPEETGITDKHDSKYDAYKLFPNNSEKPSLYSLTEDKSYLFAVNTFPNITSEKEVPLGVNIGEAGEYTINLTENYFNEMHIWLEDRILGESINLLNADSYSFTETVENTDDRFYLHFALNNKPMLNEHIPDQITNINEEYLYTIPEYIFVDNDFEDYLQYSVSDANGNELPDWLSFNQETLTFSGSPKEIQELFIIVRASDVFGKTVSDEFKLTVRSANDVFELSEKGIELYPNPTKGVFVLEFTQALKGIITIRDLSGKELVKKEIQSRNETFDISRFSKGVYIITVNTGKEQINKRIILK